VKKLGIDLQEILERGGLEYKMVRSRKPMQVDVRFEKRIKDLQKNIRMKKGEEVSLRELTAVITKDPNFDLIENRILNGNPNDINFNIRFDRRTI